MVKLTTLQNDALREKYTPPVHEQIAKVTEFEYGLLSDYTVKLYVGEKNGPVNASSFAEMSGEVVKISNVDQ